MASRQFALLAILHSDRRVAVVVAADLLFKAEIVTRRGFDDEFA